jgi:hypothetical protein
MTITELSLASSGHCSGASLQKARDPEGGQQVPTASLSKRARRANRSGANSFGNSHSVRSCHPIDVCMSRRNFKTHFGGLDLDVIEAMAASSGCERLHLIWLTGGCCDLEHTTYNARPLLLAPCSEAHPSRRAFLSMGTFIEDLRRHKPHSRPRAVRLDALGRRRSETRYIWWVTLRQRVAADRYGVLHLKSPDPGSPYRSQPNSSGTTSRSSSPGMPRAGPIRLQSQGISPWKLPRSQRRPRKRRTAPRGGRGVP